MVGSTKKNRGGYRDLWGGTLSTFGTFVFAFCTSSATRVTAAANQHAQQTTHTTWSLRRLPHGGLCGPHMQHSMLPNGQKYEQRTYVVYHTPGWGCGIVFFRPRLARIYMVPYPKYCVARVIPCSARIFASLFFSGGVLFAVCTRSVQLRSVGASATTIHCVQNQGHSPTSLGIGKS